jgi:predicted nucleotide-binding protein (sugar kinase/HSP70/actin superfamily)
MEAFADTAVDGKPAEQRAVIRTDSVPIVSLRDRKLWIPHASDIAPVLAAVLRGWGINAEPLPRSSDAGLNLARRAISEDVCLPMLITTQDLLERTLADDFEPGREALFQGQAEGPCRFGMYYMMQRRILDKTGLQEMGCVTLGSRSADGGLGLNFLLAGWGGMVGHDMLDKMRLHTRPYEAKVGESDAVFVRYLDELCQLMPSQKQLLESARGRLAVITDLHAEPVADLLLRAQRDFAAVPRLDGGGPRPVIGLVGEFFVRIHDGSNQQVIRKLEKAGAEVWLSPATEFFGYSNRIGGLLAYDWWSESRSWEEFRRAFVRSLLNHLAVRHEHRLFAATIPYLAGFDDIPPDEVIREGSHYVHPSFGGEAICSLGKARDLSRRGLAGIVSVTPFNCMPGITVAMISQQFRRDQDGIPFLNLDYDGFADAGRDAKIISFMSQVKERSAARARRGEQGARTTR